MEVVGDVTDYCFWLFLRRSRDVPLIYHAQETMNASAEFYSTLAKTHKHRSPNNIHTVGTSEREITNTRETEMGPKQHNQLVITVKVGAHDYQKCTQHVAPGARQGQ